MQLRVVIVDGIADEQALYSEVLENAGCCVMTFDDAAAALSAIRTDPPDAVLTRGVVTVDGLHLVDAIRRQPALRHVAVVVLSSRVERWVSDRASAVGADVFFLLPVPNREVIAALKRAVRLRTRLRERAPSRSV